MNYIQLHYFKAYTDFHRSNGLACVLFTGFIASTGLPAYVNLLHLLG
jgi:hypothetical protein